MKLMQGPLAVAAVCALAAAAFAQDYTVTTYGNTSGNKYVAPPTSGVTRLNLGQDGTTPVTLPFDFPYFGAVYNSAFVCSNGFIQIGVTSPSPANSTAPANWSNASFPISSTTEQGMLAPYWDELGDPSVTGAVKTWTSGTTPNRIFYVSWEGVAHYSVSAVSSLTFQIQLYEGTGRILFAYKQDSSTTTWGGGYFSNSATRSSYSMGIQSPPGDGRYTCATQVSGYPAWSLSGGTGAADYARPPNDYQFDPRVITYTGTVLYDRIVADANGIGASPVQAGQACALMPIEVRRADGSLGFRGTTDANGFFSIKTFALAATTSGSFAVLASCPACLVHTAASTTATSFTFKSNQSFTGTSGNTTALGTITIGSVADSSGAARAPIHIARVLQTTSEWVAARTTRSLGTLDVLYDPASSNTTVYVYANPGNSLPAQLRVGSTGSSNPDAWDVFALRKEYGRHVLATIAAPPTVTIGVDTRFDAVTTQENAFAEAFGCYLHAAISKETQFTDGLTSTTANVIAIEEPTLTSAKGTDVAGWVAAAMFDLVDVNNESWDWVDGTSGTAADRPFTAAATLTSPVSFSSFYTAWGTLGYDGLALSRIAIHYGLVSDDASERNDSASEASVLGPLGVRRDAQVLNVFNEDWFEVEVGTQVPHLVADVNFDRLTLNTKLTLQIQDVLGAVLATGAGVGGTGPVRATTPGAVAAGTYRVRVRHDSGVRIPAYTVQAYAPLVASSEPFVAWTVNRPYSVGLTASGGVPPYTLAVGPTYVKPAGLVLDSTTLRVSGTPVEVGQRFFVLTIADSGQPANTWSFPVQLTIHDAFTFVYGGFVGFPLGRALEWPAPVHGGTRPFTVSIDSGALPSGITFDASAARFKGTADMPGPVKFSMDGTDAAGSADRRTTTGVVCVPFAATATTADLAAGDSACGYFFDAVAGSKASIAVKTAKGKAKRALTAVVIGPDGAVVSGGKVRPGGGVATLTSIPCAASGRYYCILSSASGDATQLLAAAKLSPPAAATAKADPFAPGATLPIDFGALAGAQLTVKGVPDKASGLKLTVQALIDPNGRVLDLPAEMKLVTVGNGFALTGTLPVSGTWRLSISALPGGTGKLTWSIKLKQPKGVTFDADSIVAK